jgi:O-acetylserine/cysteine efflux transporter
VTPLDISLSVLIACIWWLYFLAAKADVAFFPVFFLLGFRLLLVALILLPFIKTTGISIRKVFLISVTFSVIHCSLMFFALQMGLDVNVAVVVDQMRVPFAALVGFVFLHERLKSKSLMGMMVAILGTFVIMETPNALGNNFAFLLAVASSLAWAFYNLQLKDLGRVKLTSFIGLVSLFGAAQLLFLSALFEENQLELLLNMPLNVGFSIAYMVIPATIIAHGIWYLLLCRYPISTVAPYTLLVPVFGMFGAVFIRGEELTIYLLVGAVLTLIGVAMVVLRRPTTIKGGNAT